MSIETAMKEKVVQAFSPEHFELVNESRHHHRGGDETHFKMLVVSEQFSGLSRLERQRRVQSLFEAERSAGLHALTLRLLTPEEWAKDKDHLSFQSPKCAGGDK
jgi:BolA protein